MTDPYIGPLSFSYGHVFDGNVYNQEKVVTQTATGVGEGLTTQNEEWVIGMLEAYQAQQLRGLSKWNEPVFIDTCPELTDNDYMIHRGWYNLSVGSPIFNEFFIKLIKQRFPFARVMRSFCFSLPIK